MIDWDHSTVSRAFDECYPLDASDRFVSEEERWLSVVKQLQIHAYVRHDDMDKFQTEFVNKLVQSRQDIGEIPPSKLKDILSKLAPTCSFNQHKHHPGNAKFQGLLESALAADAEYEANPCLDRFLYHLNFLASHPCASIHCHAWP